MKKFKAKIILLSLIIYSASCFCQETKPFQWFNVGLGLTGKGILNSLGGLNAAIDYNYQWHHKHTFQLGVSHTEEITISLGGYPISPSVNSFSLSYGKSIIGRYGIVSACVGPSLDFGHKSEEVRYATAGINLSIQSIVLPIHNLGLGLILFAQLNLVQSPIGARLVFHFNNSN